MMIQAQALSTVKLTASERRLFEELVRKHERYVFNIAYRMTGNYEEAQDLAQEAFVRAFRAFNRFEPGTSFERWLYRIVANLYIDAVRRKNHHRVESLDASYGEEQLAREVADSSADPGRIMEATHLEGEVQRALDALAPHYRMAVILSDIEGFSYEEIASIMQCSIGTVRSRIHRGRKILREALRNYLGRSKEEA